MKNRVGYASLALIVGMTTACTKNSPVQPSAGTAAVEAFAARVREESKIRAGR